MLLKGFKFGMLLQFAVGPVCIFIFQMASLKGFPIAETGVMGVALMDGLYIAVAILGMAAIIDRKNIRKFLKVFGAVILLIFGFSTVLSQIGVNFLPSLSMQNASGSSSVFVRALVLTMSNPLTVLFWAGVFSSKVAEENMKRKDVCSFGFGALLSTIFFLTLVAMAGSFAKKFLSTSAIQVMNVAVGLLLMYFGMKMLLKKVESS